MTSEVGGQQNRIRETLNVMKREGRQVMKAMNVMNRRNEGQERHKGGGETEIKSCKRLMKVKPTE